MSIVLQTGVMKYREDENDTWHPLVIQANTDLSKLIEPYSQKPWALGEYCMYLDTVYRCTTAITVAEQWDSTHWTETDIGEELKAINDEVDGLGSDDIANDSSNVSGATVTAAIDSLKDTLNSEIATRETYVRPNLLDNWYFVGSEFPINQRKQSGGSTSSGYYIDRWKSNGGAAINIASGYFYLASGVTIFQPNVHIGSVSSDTVFTFSYINHANGSLISKTDRFSSYVTVGNVSVSFNQSTKILYIRADSNVSIDAVKFEIGDNQTLAVLAGSTWTLLDIPDYQKELAKCQRYLFPVGGIAWFRSAVYDPNEIQVSIPCPPQFLADSTAASILNSSVLKVSEYNTSWVEVTGFTYSCKGRKQNMPFITISAAKTSHGMTDPVISIASTDSFILISKET